MTSNTNVVGTEVPVNLFKPVIDQRYSLLNGPIGIDGSNAGLILERRTPNTGAPTVLGYTAYNAQQTNFNIQLNGDTRMKLDSMCLHLTNCFARFSDDTPVNTVTKSVGIDWHYSQFIRNVSMRLNNGGTPVEVYNNNLFSVANKLRTLAILDRNVIENSDEMFMLPAFESDLESDIYDFSLELQARSLRNLTDVTGQTIKRSFTIPMSMILSSFHIPAIAEIHQIDLTIDWTPVNEVCFKKTSETKTPYYIIGGCELILDEAAMSPYQQSLELSSTITKNNMQNFIYKFFDVTEVNYTASSSIIQASLTNMDSAVLAFPATILTNGLNQFQYVSNNLSSIQMMLGNQTVPQLPVKIGTVQRMDNTEIYYHFKKWIGKDSQTNFTPSIPFATGYGQVINPYSNETDFLYAFKFNSAILPQMSGPRELRVISTQASSPSGNIANANCRAYLCRIRYIIFTLSNSGVVEKFWS